MDNYVAHGALDTYRATRVPMADDDTDPHRLIDMLMERALARIAIAKGHMLRGDIAEKGAHVGGAMAIIDGLRAFLDHEAGGEISVNLDNLYEYMSRRLVEANMRDDVEILDEVSALMREIRGAWVAIGSQQPS
ncbi:MAG: flagellar export chaperone FliS [Gammaproteobacteria bacterium]